MKQFNSVDKSIQYTIGRFEDGIEHFFDIKINGFDGDLYDKTTHAGQYCCFSSQTLWILKKSWIKTLLDHATKI